MATGRARQETRRRDRQGGEGRIPALSRHRPGPRGRGDLLACPRGAGEPQGAERGRGQPRCLPRSHQECGAGCGRQSAGHQPGAGRCLSGAPRSRLSGRVHALAGALAQAARRALGRAGAIGGAPPGLRPGGGDRGVPGPRILDCRCRFRDGRRSGVPGPAHPSRRQEARKPRHCGRGSCACRQGAAGRSRLQDCGRREKTGAPQPGPALHHLDPPAGSVAAARVWRRAHHAPRPAALRRRRPRRRERRPHHLYADRQRGAERGGAGRCAPADRARLRRSLSAAET